MKNLDKIITETLNQYGVPHYLYANTPNIANSLSDKISEWHEQQNSTKEVESKLMPALIARAISLLALEKIADEEYVYDNLERRHIAQTAIEDLKLNKAPHLYTEDQVYQIAAQFLRGISSEKAGYDDMPIPEIAAELKKYHSEYLTINP